MARLVRMGLAIGRSQPQEVMDLPTLKGAPAWFELWNLGEARRDYEQDSDSCAVLLERGLRSEKVVENQIGWARFWAEHDPHERMRRWFEEYEYAIRTGQVEDWAQRVKADCERVGFTVTTDRNALMMMEEDDGKTAA